MRIVEQIEFHSEAFKILLEILFTEGSFNILWTGVVIILLVSIFYPLKDKWIFIVPAITLLAVAISPFILSAAYAFLVSRTTINRSLLQVAPLIVFLCCILFERFYKSR